MSELQPPVIDFPAGDPPTELVIRDIVVGEGKEAKAGDKFDATKKKVTQLALIFDLLLDARGHVVDGVGEGEIAYHVKDQPYGLVQVFFLFDTNGKYHFDVVIALAKIKIILIDSRAVRRNKYLHHVVHYFIA